MRPLLILSILILSACNDRTPSPTAPNPSTYPIVSTWTCDEGTRRNADGTITTGRTVNNVRTCTTSRP